MTNSCSFIAAVFTAVAVGFVRSDSHTRRFVERASQPVLRELSSGLGDVENGIYHGGSEVVLFVPRGMPWSCGAISYPVLIHGG